MGCRDQTTIDGVARVCSLPDGHEEAEHCELAGATVIARWRREPRLTRTTDAGEEIPVIVTPGGKRALARIMERLELVGDVFERNEPGNLVALAVREARDVIAMIHGAARGGARGVILLGDGEKPHAGG